MAVAESIGYPVVLKMRSPEITHKTDVGGVAPRARSAEEVRAAYERIVASVARAAARGRDPGRDRPADGRQPGLRAVLGARKDPTFGAVILLGAGGVAAELLRDRALGLPPLNERLARADASSRCGSGRSSPATADAPRSTSTLCSRSLMRFSYLVADYPEISEIEINPLLAGPDGAVALDARAVVDQSLVGRTPRALLAPGDPALPRGVHARGDDQRTACA